MYLIGLMNQLKIMLIMTSCTRFIQHSALYETPLLRATSMDKIKQLMKIQFCSKADLAMYNIYLQNKSGEELRFG